MRRGVSFGLVAVLAACGIPRMPTTQAEGCEQGFGIFEQQYCADTHTQRVESVRYALSSMEARCTDAASVARAKAIRETCLPKYFTAEAERTDARREIRKKYVAQVSALLLDPAYPPAVDRYHDLEDERFRGVHVERELAAARSVLAQLCAKHGIDARYGKELSLW